MILLETGRFTSLLMHAPEFVTRYYRAADSIFFDMSYYEINDKLTPSNPSW